MREHFKFPFILMISAFALFAGCDDSSDNKTNDNNNTPSCGNGKIDQGEECDGANLDEKSCTAWSEYVSGSLTCNKSCKFDKSACVKCTNEDMSKCGKDQICSSGNCVDKDHKVTCGDNLVEAPEEDCEGKTVTNKTCADLDEFVAGDLTCDECKFVTTACKKCTKENTSLCKQGEICNDNGECEKDVSGCQGEECLACEKPSDCANRSDGKIVCQEKKCIDPALAHNPKVVISQIYPAAGNPGAIYKTKFLELLNIDETEADISGWSIQYASATGDNIANTCAIKDGTKLPKGGFYLIALKEGTNGNELEGADQICKSINPSGEKGKFYLVNNTKTLSTAKPESGYVDAVGYGEANWAEGSPMAGLGIAKAGFRKNDGCTDTNNNANDFETATPVPRNSKSEKNLCNGSYTRPEPDHTICPATGQEWSDEYSECVYPLSTKEDITNLSAKWDDYSINSTGYKVFILKDNITLDEVKNSDKTLITELKKAKIYGNNKKITVKFTNSRGLIESLDDSTIKDLTLDFNGSTDSTSLFIESVKNNSILSHLTFTGEMTVTNNQNEINSSFHSGSTVLFNNISNSTLDTIVSEMIATSKPQRMGGNMTGFAVSFDYVKASHITMKGTLNYQLANNEVTEVLNSKTPKYAFVSTIKNSTIDHLTIETNLNSDIGFAVIDEIADSTLDYVYFNPNISLTYNNSQMETLITNNLEDAWDHDVLPSFFDGGSEGLKNTTISNFEDNCSKPHMMVYSGTAVNGLKFVNSKIGIVHKLINCGSDSYPKDFTFANVIFPNLEVYHPETCSAEQTKVTTYSAYLKGDMSTVNAQALNKNLSDKKEGIPAGKYLPWYQDGAQQLHLKFNATDSELLVIP